MKYYISNPELDSTIAEIKRKIRLSMNGIVSEQMRNSGIIYKNNYGVSVPRLKEIAAEYEKNHDLAQRLWSLGIRETMILAMLIEPIEKLTYNSTLEWIKEFNQTEIIELASMNVLSKLDFSNKLVIDCIGSENIWLQTTGFTLAARIFAKLNSEEINICIESGFSLSDTENLPLYKSIALCLSRFCRKDKETVLFIQQKLENFPESASRSQQHISAEVKQEILFLDIL